MGIIRTRLTPPTEPATLIERPRLLKRLDEAEHAGLTVVLAPAGYGKTTLLSQWYRTLTSSGRACGWFTADPSDGDTVGMLTYIAAALSDAGVSLEPRLERILRTDVFPSSEFLTRVIIQALERNGGTVYLFIDDAHVLASEPIHALGRLIEQAPPTTCFITASRSLPDLHLARARARGHLHEVQAEDLKFTFDETRHFIERAEHPALDEQDLSTLQQRTEGWIAGLKLATLALRRGTAPKEMLATFGGSNRSVSDFFAEEVFSSQPQQVREFLLKTSILDRFCPALCEAVTGQSDARRQLYEIEERGLFLLQLDQERHWHRYHHLFATFLQRRLHEYDALAHRELHLRASDWFWETGSPVDAIEHALKAEAPARAAELLERRCQELTYVGKVRLVAKFAEQIPRDILHRYPGVLLTLAWRQTRALHFEEADNLIGIAGRRLDEMTGANELPPTELRRLRYLHLHREMVLTAARDRMAEVERRCQHLLEEYPEEQHPYLKGTIYGHLLAARRDQYKLSDYEKLFATAQGILKRSVYSSAAVGLQAGMGPFLLLAGKTAAARALLEQGREEGVRYSGRHSSATAVCSLPLAHLVFENNEVDLAAELIDEAMPSAVDYGFVDQLVSAFVTRTRILHARRDIPAALQNLDEGMSIAVERDLERLKLALLAERVRLLIEAGQPDEATRHAALHGISITDRAPAPGDAFTTRDEYRARIWVRLACATDHLFEAATVARQWRSFCAARGATLSLVRWDILLACIHYISGNKLAAQRSLREALTHGATVRCLRSFIDEGAIMRTLLESVEPSQSTHPTDAFADELLTAFDGGDHRTPRATADDATTDEGLYGRFSQREREILSLVASGLRNKEVAERLGMTEGTIKWYLQQVYDKIGTRRRQRAVERARQFGLIAS
ncbi:MAG TPA: LuxR C-terminal-related transcriptional regulator [Steroidobacter sp.]|uniref:LuxR C-terminal-related transcriptional regulator n=1 Tax=Steroidobacter sp. TaxID=1978227 RepID=UPI002EDA418C